MKPVILALLMSWLGCRTCRGYLVGPPDSLEELTAKADIVFKATMVSSAVVKDDWFKDCRGYAAWETRFAVISMIKGESPGGQLGFRHYDLDPAVAGQVRFYAPQNYHFAENRTYLVFAKKSEEPGIYRQFRPDHTGKEDQGVLLCRDGKPVAPGSVKEVFWKELQGLLASGNPSDVIYAVQQLDQMSEPAKSFHGTNDFERNEVLKAVGPLMSHENPEISRTVITAIGSGNPYLSEERAQYWLATVGSAKAPGISEMDSKMKNGGGELYWKELCAIADSKLPAETRALAIRALGLVRNPELKERLSHWRKDAEPAVRASAALLMVDFPSGETLKYLALLAEDSAPEVRLCAAHSIGFSQQLELANTLVTLLHDKDAKVRLAASLGLLSFSPKQERIAEVFQANLENEEFSPLFLIALAAEKPEAYLEPLAQVVERKTEPRNWSGGQIPAYTAFNILFKYLQSQPVDAVRDGKFDRHLNALENGYSTGSSEPRDLYAFYLQRGMTERAKAYREKAKKAVTYDLDYYFNMVDQSPSTYIR